MSNLIAGEFRVVVDGTVYLAEPTAKQIVECEQHWDQGWLSFFIGEDQRMERLYWVAWHILASPGKYPGDFAAFVAGLTVFEIDEAASSLPPPVPE